MASGGEGFAVAYGVVNSRGSIVNYVCDPSSGVGHFEWVHIPSAGNPPYIWTFEWRTAYACPRTQTNTGEWVYVNQ